MIRARLVGASLGLALLIAAMFKYFALAEVAVNPDLISWDLWGQLCAFTVEITLGLWLISGLFPFTVRCLSVVCFCAFAAISLYRGMRGQVSCGCLGTL